VALNCRGIDEIKKKGKMGSTRKRLFKAGAKKGKSLSV
jgi:hypothetical protein